MKKEKEAIEYLKVRLYGNEGCYLIDVAQSDLRIFLNLVEKQQKEIEKLKSRKYILNAETNEIKEIPISENYISKDKIKEKIEKITSYAYTSAEERDCQDYAIQVLKDLLGE